MDVFQLPGILRKRWIYVLAPTILFVAFALAYVVVVKPTIPVTTDILIDPQGLIAEKSDLVPAASSAGNQDSAVLESQIYVMQSSEILDVVVDKLDLTKDGFLFRGNLANKDFARTATVTALQKHLSIERAGQSFVLTLTVKHSDPAKGAEIANAIASVYLKKDHEARNDASSRASGAFELQAETLAARVRKAETELEAFKAAHDLVSTGQQGLVIDQQLEGVNKQLIAARTDLGVKRSSYEQARSLTAGSVQDGAIPEALASTALGSMRARYADMVANMNELASSLGASHPRMIAARSQVAGMRQSIEQELARIRQSLQSGMERAEGNVRALEARLSELTRSSLDTSEAGIKARQLQSEVDTLRALYKAFLARSEELGQGDAVNVNNSRVISKAVGVGGSGMLAKLMVLVAATLFGIAAGCGLAVARELLGRMLTRPGTDMPVADSEPVGVASKPIANEGDPGPLSMRSLPIAVDLLLHLHQPDQTSTIVLLSLDNDKPSPSILPRLADALYRHSKDVLYSSGEGADLSDRRHAVDAPLGDVLKFRRLSPIPEHPADSSAPTFRNSTSRRKTADYVLIDASGGEASRHLDELLAEASGILILADQHDGQKKIDAFIKSLAPFEDRMLGTLIVDKTT
ncbi:GumC family protein [Rhizobium sp. KVB221]|uniref:GumC family protein n=1 Tax=Rhizobium setariae TaxID=2801340 RepID=A0A936YPS3_9HYPH|nr:GumC family protein [Rhizobium setariae]MBL0370531.1 GumC family protein [Rhizobium setariae]